MKKSITFLIASLLLSVAGVQTAYAQKMVVTTMDNQVVKFDVSNVRDVTFEESELIITHEYVDLGLPSGTLWATCNIGADSPTDFGDYFAWGETEPKETYTDTNYKFLSDRKMTKYNATDGRTKLLAADDAATANWGAEWQMPSKEQMDELLDANNTNIQWTQMDGVNGLKVTSLSNGKSIFLPAAGYPSGATEVEVGRGGYYWSRSLYTEENWQACYMAFDYYGDGDTYYDERRTGKTIRPVKTKTNGSTDNHEWVDLDLPSGTLWATMDVGAETPEEYGYHFAWGEIVTKDKTTPSQDYSWANYKWCKGSENTMTKYCCQSSYGYNGFTDNLAELLPEDDAATANWGANWQMPSSNQITELVNSQYTTLGYMNGCMKITSNSNGNYILLHYSDPDQRNYYSGAWDEYYWAISYWSRSLSRNYNDYAVGLYENSEDDIFGSGGDDRYHGYYVRPVRVGASDRVFVERIYLPELLTLQPGKARTLIATIRPENADVKTLAWESSNTSVAKVSNTGVVTAVAVGTCTITCSATDGSRMKATCEVTVNTVSGSINGKDYIDLGLPSGTLWATCNVGADYPEEYGNYFAWGETETQDNYTWETYKYCKDSEKTMTKYCGNSNYGYNGFTDTLTELLPEDDAATKNWGANWQMPSEEQIEELINSEYTTMTHTEQNGIYGRMFTSKINGNSIFLPYADVREGTRIPQINDDYSGEYWSRSFHTYLSYYGYGLGFYNFKDHGSGDEIEYHIYRSSCSRDLGCPVRPVVKK